MVRKEGLEPSRLAVLAPEASASTNFATFALVIPMRFELMTTGFGNRYSIQLSYGIIINNNLSTEPVWHIISRKISSATKNL